LSRHATLVSELSSWAPIRNSGESPTKLMTVDSYNLSWKLIHSLHGLTPPSKSGDVILDTFETERQTIAQELIAFFRERLVQEIAKKVSLTSNSWKFLARETVSQADVELSILKIFWLKRPTPRVQFMALIT